MKRRVKNILSGICLAGLAAGLVFYFMFPDFTLAYLSNQTQATNSFTFGNVTAEIIETFTPPSSLVVGTNTYTKTVRVKNSGANPAYARVWLEFSDVNVEEISELTCDGTNWCTLTQLKSNTGLPSNWVYRNSGTLAGYFYYTKPIGPGEMTPSLIMKIRTKFISKTADINETINYTPRDYDVLVYAETVQQAKLFPGVVDSENDGLNTSYATAWTEFLNKKNN